MGHYLSEMEGGEMTPRGQASLDRFKLKLDRQKVLREARAVGMATAIEHLVRNSPLPVDLSFVTRHLGIDGRGPEAAAVSKAVVRLLSADVLFLAGDHTLRVR